MNKETHDQFRVEGLPHTYTYAKSLLSSQTNANNTSTNVFSTDENCCNTAYNPKAQYKDQFHVVQVIKQLKLPEQASSHTE